jgi:hypothetical protein
MAKTEEDKRNITQIERPQTRKNGTRNHITSKTWESMLWRSINSTSCPTGPHKKMETKGIQSPSKSQT